MGYTSLGYECLVGVGKPSKVGLVNGLYKGGISWSQLNRKKGEVIIKIACITRKFLGGIAVGQDY